MSDARWSEITAAIASAVRHFSGADGAAVLACVLPSQIDVFRQTIDP